MRLVDQYGKPFKVGDIATPQTSSISYLRNDLLESQLDGLTPARAARILKNADHGDILAQHQLFDDMLDRDTHLACEFGKRKSAPLSLDWRIAPPVDASRAEKKAAAWLDEVLRVVVDDFEDLQLALMDAAGHGFSAIELEWQIQEQERIPVFHPRPQTWFRLTQDRRALRLADGSPEGAELTPFGWVMHQHTKVKTGYLARAGLFRVLVWPFLYKSYSIGDFAEFLEAYGLPIIIGKYYQSASPSEKSSLMQAVAALGRDARAIMPQEMQIEIQKVTASGDGKPHINMIEWAERAISKAVLGQTLSADSQATGLGSGVADLHNLVRKDILKSDAVQCAGTITRDVIYPLLVLNGYDVSSLRRCPRFEFDLGSAEDLEKMAEALPKLASGGARIPVSWVHEKLRIPMAAEDEPVFRPAAPVDDAAPAALKAQAPASPAQHVPGIDTLVNHASRGAQPIVDDLIDQVGTLLQTAGTLEEAHAMLLAMYDQVHVPAGDAMINALALADLQGRADVQDGK